MYRSAASGGIQRIDNMDKTRKIKIAVSLFVPAALAGLLMPALQVSNLTEVEWDDRGYGLTAELRDTDGIRHLIRRNKAAQG